MIKKLFIELKDFFGENNELVESTNIALTERFTSPFYGYFICSWFLFNWKIIYVAFFVNQEQIFEKTKLLRHEYLQGLFPLLNSWEFWLNFILWPFMATVLFFWFFPYVTRVYFRKSLKNQKALKRIEIQESLEIKKEEKKLVQEEKKLIDETAKKVKQQKRVEAENPEVLWENEFKVFQSTSLFMKFQQILDAIYVHNGSIKVEEQDAFSLDERSHRYTIFQVSKDILIYADVNGLIKLNTGNVSLTEKGKFFAQKYSQIKAV